VLPILGAVHKLLDCHSPDDAGCLRRELLRVLAPSLKVLDPSHLREVRRA